MSRVLVVDDDKGVRLAIREMLAAEGHEVEEMPSGVDVVETCASRHFDLVITDIIMPEKEGVTLIKELRALPRCPPIIAVSGGGRTRNLDFLDIARRHGASAILPKPFTRAEFLAVAAEYIAVS